MNGMKPLVEKLRCLSLSQTVQSIVSLTLFAVSNTIICADTSRPNILWIVVDDMSPSFSCYGEEKITTPRVDELAARGCRFSQCFVTAPVCSPCRSALITGCYQTTIGAHHHRSGRGTEKIHLPAGVEPIPALFQRAGYYTCVGGPLVENSSKLGKTDYNFEWDASIYNGNDWRDRHPGQPFFAQVQLHGGKYRGQGPNREWNQRSQSLFESRTNPKTVTLPTYYPRDPVILEDWANYLDTVRFTDLQVGAVVDRLASEGILDHTIIFFITDHGISHARGKQFCYDEGLRVPLVIAGPGIPKGQVREDLVQQIDLAATSLVLAGISIPRTIQGRDLFDSSIPPRDFIHAARDRCDETVDHIRAVRSRQYKYIRNYLNEKPHLQPNRYKDGKAIIQRLRLLHEQARLTPLQEKLLFAPERPAEELYDLLADPQELHNLAHDPAHQETLATMRSQLTHWEETTGDQGRQPESKAMFDSDMAVYAAERDAARPRPTSPKEPR
jgi:arylsulfatase A-like enzyme